MSRRLGGLPGECTSFRQGHFIKNLFWDFFLFVFTCYWFCVKWSSWVGKMAASTLSAEEPLDFFWKSILGVFFGADRRAGFQNPRTGPNLSNYRRLCFTISADPWLGPNIWLDRIHAALNRGVQLQRHLSEQSPLRVSVLPAHYR